MRGVYAASSGAGRRERRQPSSFRTMQRSASDRSLVTGSKVAASMQSNRPSRAAADAHGLLEGRPVAARDAHGGERPEGAQARGDLAPEVVDAVVADVRQQAQRGAAPETRDPGEREVPQGAGRGRSRSRRRKTSTKTALPRQAATSAPPGPAPPVRGARGGSPRPWSLDRGRSHGPGRAHPLDPVLEAPHVEGVAHRIPGDHPQQGREGGQPQGEGEGNARPIAEGAPAQRNGCAGDGQPRVDRARTPRHQGPQGPREEDHRSRARPVDGGQPSREVGGTDDGVGPGPRRDVAGDGGRSAVRARGVSP